MATTKHRMHQKLSNGILGLLCFLVALSFFATLVPIAGASNDTMPCCAGKAAGHCDSGIGPKPIPQPPSEPMCGLDNSESADDAITIVAEPAHKHSESSSSQPAAGEPQSVGQPCQMNCGACAASSSRQQRRERGIVEPISRLHPSLATHSIVHNPPFSFSSNEDWDQISPRGPPASS
jgi:hypothetical protein